GRPGRQSAGVPTTTRWTGGVVGSPSYGAVALKSTAYAVTETSRPPRSAGSTRSSSGTVEIVRPSREWTTAGGQARPPSSPTGGFTTAAHPRGPKATVETLASGSSSAVRGSTDHQLPLPSAVQIAAPPVRSATAAAGRPSTTPADTRYPSSSPAAVQVTPSAERWTSVVPLPGDPGVPPRTANSVKPS